MRARRSRAPFFSVFTPSYNRGHLLSRVYESLRNQTCTDFEWLVIDDGSADNTAELVERWINEVNRFEIVYVFKENGGKASAYQVALQRAAGFAMVTIDSDDRLLSNALEVLKKEWDRVPNKESMVGVCGLFQLPNGGIVGDHFPQERLTSTALDLRHNIRNKGDKIGFNRLDVLRAFPFPRTGEQYAPESIVWNRISQHYKTVFINHAIGLKEYQADGITKRASVNSARYPKGYFLLHSELVNSDSRIPLKSMIRSLVTAQKCCWYGYSKIFLPKRFFHKALSLLLMPAVIVAMARDRRRLKT